MNPAEFLTISSAVLPDREALVSGDGEVSAASASAHTIHIPFSDNGSTSSIVNSLRNITVQGFLTAA